MMKLHPLTPRIKRFTAQLPSQLVPKEWPLSVASQLIYVQKHKRITFEGRMSQQQLNDLLAVSTGPHYTRTMRALFKRMEYETRWSIKDWMRGGDYTERFHGQYKNRRYFEMLGSADRKSFVVLCPTFLAAPVVIEVCRYGDLHAKSPKVCRFCRCPIDISSHKKMHLSLSVCSGCWGAVLMLVQEVNGSLNAALKAGVIKKFGSW